MSESNVRDKIGYATILYAFTLNRMVAVVERS